MIKDFRDRIALAEQNKKTKTHDEKKKKLAGMFADERNSMGQNTCI